MKLSNFVWLLLIILIIAIISLIYTASTNDDYVEESSDISLEGEVEESDANTTGESATPDAQEIEFFNYFEHTAPGEYSEIFVEITGFEPGVQKIIYVRDADSKEYISAGGQDMMTTDLGHISTRFTIYSYGNYEVVTYDKNGNEVVSPLLVVN